jgi:hypothetical protein
MESPANGQRPRRDKILTRWSALKSERASWVSHWQEISDYIVPRAGRFFVQDRNRGEKRHGKIYDSTATLAMRILGAGMMAGASSPARQWFRLSTSDPDVNYYYPVKVWLDDVTRRMQAVFHRSNTYRTLHTMYEDLATFGTSVSVMLPDYEGVIHHFPIPVGEFALASNYKGQIDTCYREFDKTVAELVKEFGYDKCTLNTRQMYDRGELDRWVSIIHAIEPRADRDHTKSDSKNMPWRSCYFEIGADPGQYLRESGFKYFPVLAPRWAVNAGDIYGHSAGMEALPFVKQLQHQQLRKAQGIDYMTRPPLQVPTSMKNRDLDTLPGGISFVDGASAQAGIRTSFETKLDLNYMLADIQDVRAGIRASFYADLFLMLANAPVNSRMTATEVAERHEEKLLMLGPVLERLHNELLAPLIDLTFNYMWDAGLIPPPPREIQGMDLKPDFVSMLAQAQKAVSANAMDKFLGVLGIIGQLKPESVDKLNADELIDNYADVLSIPPQIVMSDEQIQDLRAARAEAQAAKEQSAAMEQQAASINDLASAQTSQPSALTDAVSMFSGYSTAPPPAANA